MTPITVDQLNAIVGDAEGGGVWSISATREQFGETVNLQMVANESGLFEVVMVTTSTVTICTEEL